MPHTRVTVPATQVSVQSLQDSNALRSEAYIHAQVEQRLRDLVEDNRSGTKIKCLVEVVVSNRVKWPQEYVLAGLKKNKYSMMAVLHS